MRQYKSPSCPYHGGDFGMGKAREAGHRKRAGARGAARQIDKGGGKSPAAFVGLSDRSGTPRAVYCKCRSMTVTAWQNSFTAKLKVSWKDFFISLTFYNNYTSKIFLTRPAPFLPRYQGKTQHFRRVGASAERDAAPPPRPRPREAGGWFWEI